MVGVGGAGGWQAGAEAGGGAGGWLVVQVGKHRRVVRLGGAGGWRAGGGAGG